jgi:hypothetical protein
LPCQSAAGVLNVHLQPINKPLHGPALTGKARQRQQSALWNGHQACRTPEVAREYADQFWQRDILPVGNEKRLTRRGGIVYAAYEQVHQIGDTDKRTLAADRPERKGPATINEADKPQEIGTHAWTIDEWRPHDHDFQSGARRKARKLALRLKL